MDKQHRIQLPKGLLDEIDFLDNDSPIRLSVNENENEIKLTLYHKSDFPEREFIDVVSLDSKFRFILKSRLTKSWGLNSDNVSRISAKGKEIYVSFCKA